MKDYKLELSQTALPLQQPVRRGGRGEKFKFEMKLTKLYVFICKIT
jgi:hypothetical protein